LSWVNKMVKNIKKLSSEDFREIYSKVPRLCVEVLIKNSDGVLLTKRKITPWNGYWHLPGGGVLFGETLEESIKRVAKEELDVEIKIIKFVKIIDWANNKIAFGHSISLVYLVKIISGEIKLDFQTYLKNSSLLICKSCLITLLSSPLSTSSFG